MNYSSFRQLADAVIEAGGVKAVTMEALRDLTGAGKLGSLVRDEIHRQLARHHVRVLGGRLHADQRQIVWLISEDSEGGRQMVAALGFIELERRTRPNPPTTDRAA